jgi:hypothetical protein
MVVFDSGTNHLAFFASRRGGDKDEKVVVKRVWRWSSKASGDVASPSPCRACEEEEEVLLLLNHETVSASWAGPLAAGGLRPGKSFSTFF